MAINFIVEDGTGKSDATSYADLVFADQYVEDYVSDSTDWDAASDAVKQQALNRGALFLDVNYGQSLQGYRLLKAQSLDFPRTGVLDRDDYSVDTDIVPVKWKQAAVEAGVYAVSNTQLFAQLDSEGKLKGEEIKIDVITIKKQWTGSNVTASLKSKIDGLVSEFLSSGAAGGGITAEVRRG